jgi:peptidoglycan/LPS O-acetylase OafA/YrhL
MQLRPHLPVLDGIRFFAVLFVVLSHYSHWIIVDQGYHDNLTEIVDALSALGMALFFVLSGFVIHYNYSDVCPNPGGKRSFFVARFTRLYPLYITLFVIEFVSSFSLNRVACGYAGDKWGAFLALPYYLTLTQDWVYGVICQRSLLLQYHMVSDVSWSLSLEIFFYVSYPFLVGWLNRQSSVWKQIIIACLCQAAVVAFFLFCKSHWYEIERAAFIAFGKEATVDFGYENSLIRWLVYFNPVVNLVAFFFGAVVANVYFHIKDKSISEQERIWGSALTFISVVAVICAHFFIYLDIGKANWLYGGTGSSLYVPLVAAMIFCLARYSGCLWSQMIGNPLFVNLGKASYSVYLLHAFFGWNARDFYYLNLSPWFLYAIAVSFVLCISRLCYIGFERPVMRWLRRKMQTEPLSIKA